MNRKTKCLKILIFGGTGSLGRALIERWRDFHELVIVSRDEAKHWTIKNQLPEGSKVTFFVGDIRDNSRVEEILLQVNPQIVIIASALKQVDTCELAPTESLKTNVQGVGNVVASCYSLQDSLSNLECVLMVSTDKACAPTNVYGLSKALAERLLVSQSRSSHKVRFVGVRYGNVLDSRGSIVPLFRYQAQFGNTFTITDKRMTRFLMTLEESIDLIEQTLDRGENGDFWIPKLRAMRILDLVEIFSAKYGKIISEIGIRAGEKLHEDLVSTTESLRAMSFENHIVIKPESNHRSVNHEIWSYSSNSDVLDKMSLEKFLIEKHIFDKPLEDFVGKGIEEIRTSSVIENKPI